MTGLVTTGPEKGIVVAGSVGNLDGSVSTVEAVEVARRLDCTVVGEEV